MFVDIATTFRRFIHIYTKAVRQANKSDESTRSTFSSNELVCLIFVLGAIGIIVV